MVSNDRLGTYAQQPGGRNFQHSLVEGSTIGLARQTRDTRRAARANCSTFSRRVVDHRTRHSRRAAGRTDFSTFSRRWVDRWSRTTDSELTPSGRAGELFNIFSARGRSSDSTLTPGCRAGESSPGDRQGTDSEAIDRVRKYRQSFQTCTCFSGHVYYSAVTRHSRRPAGRATFSTFSDSDSNDRHGTYAGRPRELVVDLSARARSTDITITDSRLTPGGPGNFLRRSLVEGSNSRLVTDLRRGARGNSQLPIVGVSANTQTCNLRRYGLGISSSDDTTTTNYWPITHSPTNQALVSNGTYNSFAVVRFAFSSFLSASAQSGDARIAHGHSKKCRCTFIKTDK